MIGLLKTLAIFAFIYYAIKFISPYVKRYALKKVGEKLEEQMRGQFGNANEGSNQSAYRTKDKRKDGDIRVEKQKSKPINPSAQSKNYNTKNMGEYVDYEEVKE